MLAKPLIGVSGVRSSCETVATKSSFSRSTSCIRVTSRAMTTSIGSRSSLAGTRE
jgi:hypothetical protein